MATVTSHYARAALYGVERLGRDIMPFLDASGIALEIFESPESRVHTEHLARLIQCIWRGLEDEFMGCTPARCKPGTFAMMCELVSHCDTVDAIFHKGVKFYGLITDDIIMDYRQGDKRREFVVKFANPSYDRGHFFLEFWLVIWHRLVSWLVGKQIKLVDVCFTYEEPGHSAEFPYQFAAPCTYSANETSFSFGESYAKLPIVRTSQELAVFLKRSPLDLLTIPGDDDSFGRQVTTMILDAYSSSQYFPELDALAAKCHLSPPTFRRKLKDEGHSYQKIKDGLRRDIAIEKLSVQQQGVADVAEALGFSEPRSFTRAFKQWTGVTPSAYQSSGR